MSSEYPEAGAWWTVETLTTPDDDGHLPWEEAADIPAPLLKDLVFVARDSVLAFAPALPGDYPAGQCPPNFRVAHLMQIRNLWTATEVRSGGSFGDGDYSIPAYPLDWMIKQVLRPRRAVPVAL